MQSIQYMDGKDPCVNCFDMNNVLYTNLLDKIVRVTCKL